MRIRLVLAFGVLALVGMLVAWPSISAAAVAPVTPPAAADQTPATPATTDDTTQVTQACLAAHNQPTADERVAAMTKLMNDPNTVGAMGKMMSGYTGGMGAMMGGSAGSMMSGWQNGQNGGK